MKYSKLLSLRAVSRALALTVVMVVYLFVAPKTHASVAVALGVTQISAVQTFATADNTFANGWKWVFDVTVPTNEPVLQLKFADLTGIGGTIPAANNIQFYSAQSANATSTAQAILLTAANTYSARLNLLSDADTDLTRAGTQIQITVEARVPAGSAGGSYSTSYGINSSAALETSDLGTSISASQIAHDAALEGTVPGNHVVGSKAVLQSAIDSATIAKNTGTTQSDIDAANSALNAALSTFNTAVVAASDVSFLTTAKASAQALITADAIESATPGDHIVGSLSTLAGALASADATSATAQSVVDAEVATLNAAIAVYNLAIVVATVPTPPSAPVNLLSAGNFVILSKTGITNVPTSAIAGNIGTSAITGASIAGLDCAEVTGTIYTVDATGPVCRVIAPTLLTAAVLDMEAAYTDASGRPGGVGAFLNVGAGTLSGLTLVPGTYTWDSSVTIPTDLTLDANGDANAVWIFQITGTLDMSADKHVILTGGAEAKNIFWQVADVVTLGAGSHFEGTILAKTNIAMVTGATLNGRALAQTAVTLESSSVSLHVADVIAPVITLIGEPDVSIVVGSVFSFENGATALDDVDGDITSKILIGTSSFDTGVVGVYTLTYSVSDTAGNTALPVTRTVHVVAPIVPADTTAPVITLIGGSEVSMVANDPYIDAGATALDDVDGDITSRITIGTSSFDTSTPGVYTLTYSVSDAAGNHATPVTREVTVTAN